jgi:peptidylprolyl isomerase domain and WD repeat-containing protein 1
MSSKRDLQSSPDRQTPDESKKSRVESDREEAIDQDSPEQVQSEQIDNQEDHGDQDVQDARSLKNKRVEFEQLYIANLPTSEGYERSYMHREPITNVVSASKSEFIITGKQSSFSRL